MQIFNYEPAQSDKSSLAKNMKSSLSNASPRKFANYVLNALSQSPNFSDPNQAIRHYFNEWEEDGLLFFRFRVPSKTGIKNLQQIFVKYSSNIPLMVSNN